MAMRLSGGKLKEVQVSLLLSSRSEMQKVIESARTPSFPAMGAGPQPQIPQQIQQMPMITPAQLQQQIPIKQDGLDGKDKKKRSRSKSKERDWSRSDRRDSSRRRKSRSRSRDRSRRSRRSRSRSPRSGRDRYGRDVEKKVRYFII